MSKTPFDTFEEQELPADLKHWRNAFDGRYLRYFWLNGKPRIATITKVQELVSSNRKESKKQLLISLAEADKKWAANVTNCDIIEMLTGKKDPREWVGTKIELYETTTRLPDGKIGPCMRVRETLPPQNTKTEKAKYRQEVSQYLDEMKRAEDLGTLASVQDRLVEDNTLSGQETELLLAGLKRRREQLGAA